MNLENLFYFLVGDLIEKFISNEIYRNKIIFDGYLDFKSSQKIRQSIS